MASAYRLEPALLAGLRFDNVRKEFGNEDDLRRLGESLRKRQHHPIFCQEDGLVYDGERRVRAALLVGLTELLAIITERPLSAAERTELQFETAFFRADLTGFEKFEAVTAIQAAHADWSNKQLAEHLQLDPKMVKVLLSPSQCVPEAVESLRLGRIGISVCHDLSLLPGDEQLPLLNLALAGASRDYVARAGRKKRTGSAPAVRVKRCKFARPSGNVVSLSGDDMSLEEAANELADLAAEMRRADKGGISIKTFMANCRDKAEAGV